MTTDLTYYRGRVALYAILKAMGIRRGDEVAIQAFTCVAVPSAVIATGAVPLFIDIADGAVTMDPDHLENRVSDKTRAVVVQHTFGIPAHMDEINAVANRWGIPVVEDCCHSLSSTYAGRRVGTLGAAAFFSYEWGKPIVAGIGGTADVADPALRVRMNEDYSRLVDPGALRTLRIAVQYLAFHVAYRPGLYWATRRAFHIAARLGAAEGNYSAAQSFAMNEEYRMRMSSFSRLVLRRALPRLQELDRVRRSLCREYERHVEEYGLSVPVVPRNADPVYVRFPVFARDKQRVLERARAARVELADWYRTPVHPLEATAISSAGYVPGSCPRAEDTCRRIVTLPTHHRVRVSKLGEVMKLIAS
jgi:perosamine synthetase